MGKGGWRKKHILKKDMQRDVEKSDSTFCRSFMEPLPSTAILHIVSSWRRFMEFPLGPSSLPTKLNCDRKTQILVTIAATATNIRDCVKFRFWPTMNTRRVQEIKIFIEFLRKRFTFFSLYYSTLAHLQREIKRNGWETERDLLRYLSGKKTVVRTLWKSTSIKRTQRSIKL